MDSAEQVVKDFTKATEVLPFNKCGLSTLTQFREAASELEHLEILKRAGLTEEEIKLYHDFEDGTLYDKKAKIESTILEKKLNRILKKLSSHNDSKISSECKDEEPSTSNTAEKHSLLQTKPSTTYPDGHPMNNILEMESELLSHLTNKDDMLPLCKRRKIMRRLEKRKEELEAQEREVIPIQLEPRNYEERDRNSLWDVRDKKREKPTTSRIPDFIGPRDGTMYTVRDSKIIRLEPSAEHETGEQIHVHVSIESNENGNSALLEGTKISVDEIRKMERFKNYEPGIPSKILYLKNLRPTVTQEQVSILFNQFISNNKGPVDVHLMTGRMRGQAFVTFQFEHVAIQALEEINGTVLTGRPIIAEFGRSSNRIQDDDR